MNNVIYYHLPDLLFPHALSAYHLRIIVLIDVSDRTGFARGHCAFAREDGMQIPGEPGRAVLHQVCSRSIEGNLKSTRYGQMSRNNILQGINAPGSGP